MQLWLLEAQVVSRKVPDIHVQISLLAQRFHVVIRYMLGPESRYMGTPLGPKYVPYPYLDPLGRKGPIILSSFHVHIGELELGIDKFSLQGQGYIMRRDAISVRASARRSLRTKLTGWVSQNRCFQQKPANARKKSLKPPCLFLVSGVDCSIRGFIVCNI